MLQEQLDTFRSQKLSQRLAKEAKPEAETLEHVPVLHAEGMERVLP